jgi:hypothetical protein
MGLCQGTPLVYLVFKVLKNQVKRENKLPKCEV